MPHVLVATEVMVAIKSAAVTLAATADIHGYGGGGRGGGGGRRRSLNI